MSIHVSWSFSTPRKSGSSCRTVRYNRPRPHYGMLSSQRPQQLSFVVTACDSTRVQSSHTFHDSRQESTVLETVLYLAARSERLDRVDRGLSITHNFFADLDSEVNVR